MNSPRRIRVFHDYGSGTPLWEIGTVEPSEFDLSPRLRELIDESTDLFDDHFHPDHSWSSPADKDAYAFRMRQVVALLRRELHDVAEIVDEHEWCLRP